MPRAPSSLTTYDLLHTPGIYAVVGRGYNLVLVPVQLVGITATRDGRTLPIFRDRNVERDYQVGADEILFEPYELPQILRDMLWPREVPTEVVAPVAPIPADECDERCAESCPRRQSDTDTDTDTAPAGSSDYDGPSF
jgi:hypothetical protein